MADYLSDDDLQALRALIGADPDDATVHNMFLRLQNIYLVANEVLSTRLNTLLTTPAQFSVPGYSENRSANISALQKQLAYVQSVMIAEGVGATAGVITSAPLTRTHTRR